MRDESAKECYDCKQLFGAFLRKHHCRICGLIFCHKCASNFIPGQPLGFEGEVRVCNFCLARLSAQAESPLQTPRPLSTTESLFGAPQMLEAAVNAFANIPFRQSSRGTGPEFGMTPTDISPLAAMVRRPIDAATRAVKFAPGFLSGRSSPGAAHDVEPQTMDKDVGDSPVAPTRDVNGFIPVGPGASGDVSITSQSSDLSRRSTPILGDDRSRPGSVLEDVSDDEEDDTWNYAPAPLRRAGSGFSVTGPGGATSSPSAATERLAVVDDVRAQFMRQRQRSRRSVSGRANKQLRHPSGTGLGLNDGPRPDERSSWYIRDRSRSPIRFGEPAQVYDYLFDFQGAVVVHLVSSQDRRFVTLFLTSSPSFSGK